MSGDVVVYLMIMCLVVGALGGVLAGNAMAEARASRELPSTGTHAAERALGSSTQRGAVWPSPVSPRLTDRFVHAPEPAAGPDELPRQYGTRAEHERREAYRRTPPARPGAALVAAVALSMADRVERELGVGHHRPHVEPDPEQHFASWLTDTGQLPGLLESTWTPTSRAA